jgi:hypothetical protein
MENAIVKTNENVHITNNVIDNMSRAYKLAQTMCQADIIPQSYKNKPADCMIAIDMANRMGVSPLMVMQSLYVVMGKPSWSGQACMSFIQANPNFKDVTPVYVGQPNTSERGCYIQATRVSDGAVIQGVCVTLGMANAEGWTDKKGSKWLTMPELMLAYRASAFFARVYCPSLLMGVAVEGEIEDITQSQNKNRKVEDVL